MSLFRWAGPWQLAGRARAIWSLLFAGGRSLPFVLEQPGLCPSSPGVCFALQGSPPAPTGLVRPFHLGLQRVPVASYPLLLLLVAPWQLLVCRGLVRCGVNPRS